MRKITILVFLVLVLTSCFGDSSEVIKAKQELGVIENTPTFDLVDKTKEEEKKENNIDVGYDPRISIKQISGEKILKLEELKYIDFKNGHAKIKGKTLGFVSKIKVEFSNENSTYPNDEYILAKFKSGGDDFEYNANSKYKVLDFGLNKYLITAFTSNGESILELKVLVSIKDDEYLDGEKKLDLNREETSINKLIGDETNIIFAELPEGGDFGNVVKLGEKSFTYSDIKGFEVKKEKLEKFDCGKNEETGRYFVTEFLGERQKSWYYWNTCRDLVKDSGISFYVTRLSGDDYFYEKHYLDFVHGFYGIYEIEKGQGVDKDNISDKNKQLKELNETFKQTEIVDNLFKKIIK